MLGDPLRTTLVLLAIIAVLAGAGRLLSTPAGDPVPAVDYETPLEAAQEAAPYRVLGPADLPDGWRATSVRYLAGSARWHLGILTDQERYIGIEQSPQSPEELVEEFAPAAQPEGTLELAGDTWELLRAVERTTLVRRGDGATTLVTGTAPQATIREFVESLTEDD